ncbi:tyrosine-protein phosphatase [Pilimelia anulata]|uniref:tyrosine-protein phosphatase n=1 Tax=Pilimelia anulata TaxID=53371 RepID=UPI0016635DE5
MVDTPPRRLTFSALFNFRDLGGYRTGGGHTVRWRRLFRSDSLHRLTLADAAAFDALGIRTVIDLRRVTEVDRDGRVPGHDRFAYHHIEPMHELWEATPPPTDGTGHARWLADRYLDLARDGAGGIAAALAVIADPDSAPVTVHCVAGKDRTGVVCAVALALLGVADDEIAVDYALSAEATTDLLAWVAETGAELPDLPPAYFASPAEAMRLFLAELRAAYGSVEAYARAAGLAPAQLAALRGHLLDATGPVPAGPAATDRDAAGNDGAG